MHLTAPAVLTLAFLAAAVPACGSSASDDASTGTQSSEQTTEKQYRGLSFLVASDLHFGYVPGQSIFADEATAAQGTVDVNADEPDDEDEDGDNVADVATASAPTPPTVYQLNKQQVQVMNSLSNATNTAALNALGMSNDFRGTIVTGDVTDNGRGYQWDGFQKLYGVNGQLNLPVFEAGGNHDYSWRTTNALYTDPKQVYVLSKIAARNTAAVRPGWVENDANGSGAYAYHFGNVLFVNLGVKASDANNSMIPRTNSDGTQTLYRNTDPFSSLTFLKKVLRDHDPNNDHRIVLSFHYPIHTANYRFNDDERAALFGAIKKHHVVAMFHGHRHVSSHYEWCGIPIFEVDTPRSAIHRGYDSSFLAVDINDDRIKATTVRWRYDFSANPSPQAGFDNDCKLFNSKDSCWRSEKSFKDIPVPDTCPTINVPE